jgi:hypothetical protein
MADWQSILPAIVAIIVAVLTIYKGVRHIQCGKCCSVDLEPVEKTQVDQSIGLIQSLVNKFTPRRTPKTIAPPHNDLEMAGPSSESLPPSTL